MKFRIGSQSCHDVTAILTSDVVLFRKYDSIVLIKKDKRTLSVTTEYERATGERLERATELCIWVSY